MVVTSTTTTGAGAFYSAYNPQTIYKLRGMTISGACTNLISSTYGSNIEIQNIVFGLLTVGTAHLYTFAGGRINVTGNYSITGGASYHMYSAGPGSFINNSSHTIPISGSPAFNVFNAVDRLAMNNTWGLTFSSGSTSVTGQRYLASVNAVIYALGAVYPGNTSGSTTNGGLCIN